MVAVFASGIAQIKFGVAVALEKILHAIGVIVMRMTQDSGIDCSDVDSHESGVLGELRGGSRVEQNAFAVEFGADAKSPFTL